MTKKQSIKLENNKYLDTSSIVHNRKRLSNLIDENGIAKYEGGNIDPNVTLYDLILTSHENAQQTDTTREFFYIMTMFYQSKTVTSNRCQIAFGYRKNRIAYRYYYRGTWSEWGVH